MWTVAEQHVLGTGAPLYPLITFQESEHPTLGTLGSQVVPQISRSE